MSERTITHIYVVGNPQIPKDKPFRFTIKDETSSETFRFRTREEAEQAYSAHDIQPIESRSHAG